MVDISNPVFSTIDASNNANSPNGYNSTTTPANVIAIEQAYRGAVKRLWERMGPALSSTGSLNNYVVTPSNTAYPTALVQGDVYCFIASFTNTSSANLTYNGLLPVTIKKPGNTGPVNLTGGEIVSGQLVMVGYDGVNAQLISGVASGTTGTPLIAANNLSDLTNTATARTNLGLGTAATKSTGTNGANIPVLNAANTWSATQAFAALTATSLSGPGSSITALNATNLASGTVPQARLLAPKILNYSRDTAIATSTQTLTGAGFTPRSVIILMGVSGEAGRLSIGHTDGTNQACVYRDVSNGSFGFVPDSTILAQDSPGVTSYIGIFSAFNSDGMVISWVQNGSPTGVVNFSVMYFP